MPMGWGGGYGGRVVEPPKIGRPKRDRDKVKASRKAARRRK